MKTYGNLRKNVNAANLDSLMLELRCDSSMLDAIHVAMVEGMSPADNYTDALFGVVLCFRDLIDKFSDEILRGERKWLTFRFSTTPILISTHVLHAEDDLLLFYFI